MHDALGPNGIVCTQGECQWLHLDLIANVLSNVRKIFPTSKYAYSTVPTYPSGQIGYILASKDSSNDLSIPKRPCELNFQYYTSEIHKAAFVLPAFAAKRLL